ncbi:MAG: hypothetical protein JWM20_305 [Patescibacteria group bacterium]|nr:hypothetical protein [Patescibacteria group bacterium]
MPALLLAHACFSQVYTEGPGYSGPANKRTLDQTWGKYPPSISQDRFQSLTGIVVDTAANAITFTNGVKINLDRKYKILCDKTEPTAFSTGTPYFKIHEKGNLKLECFWSEDSATGPVAAQFFELMNNQELALGKLADGTKFYYSKEHDYDQLVFPDQEKYTLLIPKEGKIFKVYFCFDKGKEDKDFIGAISKLQI